MKKLMKNVAVLALAAAVAVGSVTGVSAAVKSPTSSLVPVNAKNVAVSNGNTVDTKANGTAEVGAVVAKKSTATVPSKVTVKGVTYTVTVIKAKAFAKKAQENNQSPFSPENVNKLGSNHEYEKLNTLSKQFQNQLGTQHPLYPYYQFTPSQEYEGNLVSSPLRDDARKKYPPRFVLNGIAKIGDDKINELSPEIIEYANRLG